MGSSDFTVTLGDQEYQIPTLPIRGAREVRLLLAQKLNRITDFLDSVDITQVDNASALAKLLTEVKDLLINSPDLVEEIFFAYAKTLLPVRDTILDTADDEQMVIAFIEVFKRLYPFAQLTKMLLGLGSLQTTKKLNSQSGEKHGTQNTTK